MPWVIAFIITWAIFLVFVDFRKLKDSIAGGFLAVVMAILVDWGAQHLQLYEFYQIIIPFAGIPTFYLLGPIFTMGVLFVQFIPRGKWLQALHILMFSLTNVSMEYLAVQANAAEYIHWHSGASLFFNLLVFAALTWIATTFILERT